MKHTIPIFAIALLALFCVTGCQIAAPSTIVMKTVDPKTGQETTTTTTESAFKSFLDSTKGKLVYVSRQGWAGGIYFVPPASDTSNPAGVLKIVAGKSDDTYLSIPVASISGKWIVNSLSGIGGIVAAGRAGDISLTSSGISAKSGTDSNSSSGQTGDAK